MLKDAISNLTVVDTRSRIVVVCNTCNLVIAEDNGDQDSLPIIITAVNGHTSVPNIFLKKRFNHEILTVDMNHYTSTNGLRLEKDYSD